MLWLVVRLEITDLKYPVFPRLCRDCGWQRIAMDKCADCKKGSNHTKRFFNRKEKK